MSEAGSSDLQQDLHLVQNLTIVRGSHSIKTGFNYTSPTTTLRPPARSAAPTISLVATREAAMAISHSAISFHSIATACRPGRKIRRKPLRCVRSGRLEMTQNYLILGLRYELQVIRPVVYGQAAMFIPSAGKIAVFASTLPSGAVPAAVSAYPVVLSGFLGLPTSLMDYRAKHHQFRTACGPCLYAGAADVLRSGFGLYYNVLPLNYTQWRRTTFLPDRGHVSYEQPSGSVPGFTMYNPFLGNLSLPANPNAQLYNATTTPYNLQWHRHFNAGPRCDCASCGLL